MKKLLFLAAIAGVALVGCAQNSEETPAPESKQEISFEVAKYKASETRAEVDYPTSVPFGTFAYYEGSLAEGHHVWMDNVKIIYKPIGTGIWSAEKDQYLWPSQGHLDFISYSPYNSDKTAASVPQISDSDIQQTLKYNEFEVDAANPIDLLYSRKAMQQTSNTQIYGFLGVPTLFHHALAKMTFMVKALRLDNSVSSPGNVTTWEVTVNSIVIENIYNKGSLTLNCVNDHASGKTTVDWHNANTSANVWTNTSATTSKEWSVDQVLTTTASVYGAGTSTEAKDYFILPQILLDNQQKITVNYTIKTTAPNGQTGTVTYSTAKYFNEFTSVDNWEIGKNIIYTIDIDPAGDEIHFAPKVVDWEDINGTISI